MTRISLMALLAALGSSCSTPTEMTDIPVETLVATAYRYEPDLTLTELGLIADQFERRCGNLEIVFDRDLTSGVGLAEGCQRFYATLLVRLASMESKAADASLTRAKLLIEYGSDPFGPNAFGANPYFVAVFMENWRMADLFLSYSVRFPETAVATICDISRSYPIALTHLATIDQLNICSQ